MKTWQARSLKIKFSFYFKKIIKLLYKKKKGFLFSHIFEKILFLLNFKKVF